MAKTVKREDDLYDGVCEAPGCVFVTMAWPTEKAATTRIEQHVNEHETGELMQDMESFTAEHAPELNS